MKIVFAEVVKVFGELRPYSALLSQTCFKVESEEDGYQLRH